MRMYPHSAKYQAAYVGDFPGDDDSISFAVRWASERAELLGCGITTVAPTRNHFKMHPLLVVPTPFGVSTETPQTIRGTRTEPVIVVCWPTESTLDRLDSLPGLKALCVVAALETDIEHWRRARGAVDLRAPSKVPAALEIADQAVLAAMKSLSRFVNLNTGITNPKDRDAAMWVFELLRRAGYRYTPDEIRSWSMANGWEASDATKLAEVARGVLEGRSSRTGSNPWREDIIDLWRSVDGTEDADKG